MEGKNSMMNELTGKIKIEYKYIIIQVKLHDLEKSQVFIQKWIFLLWRDRSGVYGREGFGIFCEFQLYF